MDSLVLEGWRFGHARAGAIRSRQLGCEWGMAVGLKYVVFEKKDAPLNYYGWCGDRVMSDGIIKLDYMRTLRDAR